MFDWRFIFKVIFILAALIFGAIALAATSVFSQPAFLALLFVLVAIAIPNPK